MPGVVLIVSITDICLLPNFLYSHEYKLTRNTVYYAILSDQIVVGCSLGVSISYYTFTVDSCDLYFTNFLFPNYLRGFWSMYLCSR